MRVKREVKARNSPHPSPGAPDGVNDEVDIWRLAKEQGVEPVRDISSLYGDFWPEDESVEEFLVTLRRWRQEGG
jgi:hypothetical protein